MDVTLEIGNDTMIRKGTTKASVGKRELLDVLQLKSKSGHKDPLSHRLERHTSISTWAPVIMTVAIPFFEVHSCVI